MDILPAIANVEQMPDGILLTDTELVRWQKSNPKEYAAWFHRAMATQFDRKRAEIAESLKASIEDVPEWRVKTPLQRAVQLLKRHRDVYFKAAPDNRPVSIIITTLAARAYQNQENVYDAMAGLIADMPGPSNAGTAAGRVENPVEPTRRLSRTNGTSSPSAVSRSWRGCNGCVAMLNRTSSANPYKRARRLSRSNSATGSRIKRRADSWRVSVSRLRPSPSPRARCR